VGVPGQPLFVFLPKREQLPELRLRGTLPGLISAQTLGSLVALA
jgi:hypothetical protein